MKTLFTLFELTLTANIFEGNGDMKGFAQEMHNIKVLRDVACYFFIDWYCCQSSVTLGLTVSALIKKKAVYQMMWSYSLAADGR